MRYRTSRTPYVPHVMPSCSERKKLQCELDAALELECDDAEEKQSLAMQKLQQKMKHLKKLRAKLAAAKEAENTTNGATDKENIEDEPHAVIIAKEVARCALQDRVGELEEQVKDRAIVVNSLYEAGAPAGAAAMSEASLKQRVAIKPHEVPAACSASPVLAEIANDIRLNFFALESAAQIISENVIDDIFKKTNWASYHLRTAIRSEDPGSGPYIGVLKAFKKHLLTNEVAISKENLELIDLVLSENAALKAMLNYAP